MSLATRCPACGTVFRVVQDQLRVSDGWVRCGRCAEVFSGVENLVDLEHEGPPLHIAGGSAHRDRVIEDLARVAGQAAAPQTPSWSGDGAAETAAVPRSPVLPPAGPVGAVEVIEPNEPSEAPAPPEPSRRRSPAAPSPLRVGATEAGPGDDSELDDPRPADPAPDLRAEPPLFVRQAERAASWRTSRHRAALAGAVLLAAAALVLQVAMAYRDLIAARWTVLRPPLALLCTWADCRIEAPRQADALVVDSSGLVRVDRTSTYRLSVVVRNRAPIDLAVPAVDLTLTDVQGMVIARRVLDPAELGVTQGSLPGGGELSMKAVLALGGGQVSGYTIEVFYP